MPLRQPAPDPGVMDRAPELDGGAKVGASVREAGAAAAPVAKVRPAEAPAPAQLHGLERAIERAEMRQVGNAAEVQLWMRTDQLGKVAVRLMERAGLIEVAVRAANPVTRGWLAEGLPALVDSMRERGFDVRDSGPTALAAPDWWAQDRHGRQPGQGRDDKKRRPEQEPAEFSLNPGDVS